MVAKEYGCGKLTKCDPPSLTDLFRFALLVVLDSRDTFLTPHKDSNPGWANFKGVNHPGFEPHFCPCYLCDLEHVINLTETP